MTFKYNEDALIQEPRDYIASTYNQHYSAGNDKIQTLDLIESVGDAEAFCRSNILKYASRYDKKGTARRHHQDPSLCIAASPLQRQDLRYRNLQSMSKVFLSNQTLQVLKELFNHQQFYPHS